MARMRAGSQEAAWRLVEVYESHIRAVVRRRLTPAMRSLFDSDDFVQTVWASLIRITPRLGFRRRGLRAGQGADAAFQGTNRQRLLQGFLG